MSTTSSPASAPPIDAPAKPAFCFERLFERFSTWALPLAAILFLLIALEEAVRAGQMRASLAGLTVYLASLAMWFPSAYVQKHISNRPAPISPSTYTQQASTPPEPQDHKELHRFAQFGQWFFPSLAILALAVANAFAAIHLEQLWLVSGAITFAGCFLVWAGWLYIPLRPKGAASSPGAMSVEYSRFGPRFTVYAGLTLVMPLGILAGAIVFEQAGHQLIWLLASVICLVLYLLGAFDRSMRGLVRNGRVSFLVYSAGGVAISLVSAGLAIAIHFHRLPWIPAALIGICISLINSVLQAVGWIPPKEGQDPSSVISSGIATPALFFAGLVGLAVYAVVRHEIPAHTAAGLVLLGGLGLWFSWMFMASLRVDGPPQVESTWTGLGGGIGGWRCSPSLVYGICALTFAILAGLMFLQTSPKPAAQSSAPTPAQSAAPSVAYTTQADNNTAGGNAAQRK
jgi:hypothetical protein